MRDATADRVAVRVLVALVVGIIFAAARLRKGS